MAVNIQPSGHQVMQIASHTNPNHLPLNSSGKRGWSVSFCGCFSACGTCLTACFCPCIVYSKIGSRINHLANRGSPHPSGGDARTGPCWGYAMTCCIGAACYLQCIQRGNTRNRYNISGNCCGDCCAAWCCYVCGLVQESREIALEEKFSGSIDFTFPT